MPNYAYLDRYNVLHTVEDAKTAVCFSGNGKVAVTQMPCQGGYPIVNGKTVVYEDGRAFVDGNIKSGIEIAVPSDIQVILNQLA